MTMTTHKNLIIPPFALLICVALILFGSFAPDAFGRLDMKLYGDYINLNEYFKRLLRLGSISVFMNFGFLIFFHILYSVHNNSYYRMFLYSLLVLQSLPSIEILLDHYKQNISNPSEMSVFYRLTGEFGWVAHLFYAAPLLSFMFAIMIWLIYKRITKSS